MGAEPSGLRPRSSTPDRWAGAPIDSRSGTHLDLVKVSATSNPGISRQRGSVRAGEDSSRGWGAPCRGCRWGTATPAFRRTGSKPRRHRLLYEAYNGAGSFGWLRPSLRIYSSHTLHLIPGRCGGCGGACPEPQTEQVSTDVERVPVRAGHRAARRGQVVAARPGHRPGPLGARGGALRRGPGAAPGGPPSGRDRVGRVRRDGQLLPRHHPADELGTRRYLLGREVTPGGGGTPGARRVVGRRALSSRTPNDGQDARRDSRVAWSIASASSARFIDERPGMS